jgi:hypothetical protein
MHVDVVYRTDPDRNIRDPLPEENGFVFRLVRGDLFDPIGDPNSWFEPPWPKRVLRHYFRWLAFPFFAWKLGRFRGYIGAKVYGFDRPEYLNFPTVEDYDVFDGSEAFCFSFRMSRSTD